MDTQPISYRADLVGVFGCPVAENPTGVMQEAAFQERGLNWRYLTIEVRPEQLADAMRGLRAFNMRGINLTIPHKVSVIQHLDRLSSEAELIGAVNTVVLEDGLLVGHNTDGKGFLRSVRDDAGMDPRGKRVVFLGAGGAARAMSVEMALAGAKHITVVNRTASRAKQLVAHLADKTSVASEWVAWDYDYVVPPETDILINATSIGLFPHTAEVPRVARSSFRPGLLVCDVVPNPPRTAFLATAAAEKATTLDGLGMLVYQGAIAFHMWTGTEPSIPVMRQALERIFGT